MAVLLPLMFCALWADAQLSLTEKIFDILETTDLIEAGRKFKEIKDINIDDEQLTDSALFGYHMLFGGFFSSEYSSESQDSSMLNQDQAISHLLEAKKISETSLGVHSINYMSLMKMLGNEYFELGNYEEALAIFQEGLVKCIFLRNTEFQTFSLLILHISECYERLGWFDEIPNHLYDAWSFWKVDSEHFTTVNYYPLWNLQQFYNRYEMYDKALEVNDQINEFIISDGRDEMHPELINSFFFRGCYLENAGRIQEAISAYHKALFIAKENNLLYSKDLNSVYCNLIVALADEGDVERCNNLLSEINKYSKAISDPAFYANAVYNCATHFANSHRYEEALNYIEQIPTDIYTDDEIKYLNQLRQAYTDNLNIITKFDKLVNSLANYSEGSPEWFNTIYDIELGYNLKGNFQESFKLLEHVYNVYLDHQDVEAASPSYLFDRLTTCASQLQDYDAFLKYANAKQDYLNKLEVDTSSKIYVNSLNGVVVAQVLCKQLDGIDEKLNQLESNFKVLYGDKSVEYAAYLHNRGRAYQLQNKLEEAKSSFLKSIAIQGEVQAQITGKTIKYLKEVEQALSDI